MKKENQKEIENFFVCEDIRIANIKNAVVVIETQLEIIKAQKDALCADIKEIKRRLKLE